MAESDKKAWEEREPRPAAGAPRTGAPHDDLESFFASTYLLGGYAGAPGHGMGCVGLNLGMGGVGPGMGSVVNSITGAAGSGVNGFNFGGGIGPDRQRIRSGPRHVRRTSPARRHGRPPPRRGADGYGAVFSHRWDCAFPPPAPPSTTWHTFSGERVDPRIRHGGEQLGSSEGHLRGVHGGARQAPRPAALRFD